MGMYLIGCPTCGETHYWFSGTGNFDQRCEKCKRPKKSSIIHAADTTYDNEYGDSYIPLCVGPGHEIAVENVTYFDRNVTCKSCKEKLHG